MGEIATVISNVPGKTTYAGSRTPQWKIHISILQDFPGTKGYPKKRPENIAHLFSLLKGLRVDDHGSRPKLRSCHRNERILQLVRRSKKILLAGG